MPMGDDEEPLLALDDEMRSISSNDEWVYRQADRLAARLPGRKGHDRRTEGEVFDQPTLMTLHKFLTHGVLRSLDFPVSTGKEANVFRGTAPSGAFRAVKIYRVNTATFKHVLKYIQGDPRFQGVSGDKRSLVHAWCQKEFRNLLRLREAGVSVPEPMKALGNVLVMEYLGKAEGPWPSLKATAPVQDARRMWDLLADDVVRSYNEAQLVHADLSEYNILVERSDEPPEVRRPRIIDVGQAVLHSHPMAREFLERDLHNLVRFFRAQGLDVQASDITSRFKAPKKKGEDEEA
ncbi:MAG TPA: serine protein kinase RIO [Candidatus Thermoplasmatota archaeon]|nr:serine protein kinase RIO [Candidatus Thermoplasmatota archaeon]